MDVEIYWTIAPQILIGAVQGAVVVREAESVCSPN